MGHLIKKTVTRSLNGPVGKEMAMTRSTTHTITSPAAS